MAVLGVMVASLAACSGSDGDETARESDRGESASEPDRGETSWEDIEPCSLLSADALMSAGVQDAEGVREEQPAPSTGAPGQLGPRCVWGERYDETTAYVTANLWDPPLRDLFDEYRQFEVAGRDAYSADEEDNGIECMVDVNNGEYFIHINLEKASSDGAPACEIAASLASDAVSALD